MVLIVKWSNHRITISMAIFTILEEYQSQGSKFHSQGLATASDEHLELKLHNFVGILGRTMLEQH